MASAMQGVALPAEPRAPSLWRVFRVEAQMECLRLLRSPAFAVPIVMFPLMFYALFGLVLGGSHMEVRAGAHVLANFMAFGAIAPGLFGVGITVAIDRDRGLLELKRALPMPPGVYLAAKLVTSMIFAGLVSVLLIVLAAVVGRVVLELVQWVSLFVLAVFGVIPFCGLGLLIGSFLKGQAAPAVLNLIYVPMSFLAGIWVPLSALPHVVAQLAPVWPAYHLVKLAQAAVGEANTDPTAHVLSLAGATALFFAWARRGLRRVR